MSTETKDVYVLRGVPGCGKSTLAETLIRIADAASKTTKVCSADQFWIDDDGEYKFDMRRLREAHEWCREQYSQALADGVEFIIVDNTNTQLKEMQHYLEEGRGAGYRVTTLIVENRHEGESTHNVPKFRLEVMRNRFEVEL